MMYNDHPQTPLLEGETATFIWYGPEPPGLVGDFNRWKADDSPYFQQTGPEQWTASLIVPEDAYFEYVFQVDGENVLDPLNSRRTSNGMRGFNSYFYTQPGRPFIPIDPQVESQSGSLERCILRHKHFLSGGKRVTYFYQPPVDEPCPLLVVFDGVDYLRRVRLNVLVEKLILAGRIQPVALALVAGAGQNRTLEYACNDATLGFLQEVLLPAAQERLNLISWEQSPGAYGVLGASMGGLISLYTGLRLPQIFGRVISQSGAFLPGTVIEELIHSQEFKQLDIWMDVGRFEYLLEDNLRMEALLRSRGYPVDLRVFNAGHNYTAWRNDVWRGLENVYPANVLNGSRAGA